MKKRIFIGILLILILNNLACGMTKSEENVQQEYEAYMQGIYLSADGASSSICIQPIAFIYESDTEEIKKYHLEDEDWAAGYYILDDMGDVMTLPINADTKYILINWKDDQELLKNSIPDENAFYCEVTDPVYFLQYMQESYGEKLTSYPLYLKIGELGYVEYIKEMILP